MEIGGDGGGSWGPGGGGGGGGDDNWKAPCTRVIRGFCCKPVILVSWVPKVPYKVRNPGDEFPRKEVR